MTIPNQCWKPLAIAMFAVGAAVITKQAEVGMILGSLGVLFLTASPTERFTQPTKVPTTSKLALPIISGGCAGLFVYAVYRLLVKQPMAAAAGTTLQNIVLTAITLIITLSLPLIMVKQDSNTIHMKYDEKKLQILSNVLIGLAGVYAMFTVLYHMG